MSRIIVDAIRNSSAGSDGITLSSDGKVAFPNTSTGKILQVVQTVVTGTYSEAFANTTSSASCGLDLNITPSATSSKILIQAVANVSNSDAVVTMAGIILFRGGSILSAATGDADGNRQRVSSQAGLGNFSYQCAAIPFHYLDSPNSTSQQSYSIRLRYNTTSSSETVYLNRTRDDDNAYYRDRSISTITAMEVAA